MTPLRVILACLWPRSRFMARKMGHHENYQSRFSLSYSDEESMGFLSENGGPVTVNGAFQRSAPRGSSAHEAVQASPKARLARRSLTGRTKCDWPASADRLFSSFRERSERLGDALSRLISISFVNGMFFFGSCLLHVDFGAHEWQTIVDTSSWRIS